MATRKDWEHLLGSWSAPKGQLVALFGMANRLQLWPFISYNWL